MLASWSRFGRRARAAELRALYRTLRAERGNVLLGAVQFHVEYLDEYWSRCVGFLEDAERSGVALGPSFLAGDWLLAPLIASHEANAEIEAYCRAVGADDLRSAWRAYRGQLEAAKAGRPSVADGIRAAAAAFGGVYELSPGSPSGRG